jgi:hypothetical protein
MWKYEFLDNERTGKGNLIKVNVAVSDESNAEIDRLKYEAEKLAGPNLPAWEKARIGYRTDPEYIKYSQDMAAKLSAELLEAEINQPAAKNPALPTADEINKIKASIPQLPAQDGDLGNGVRVTTNPDGTRSYKSGAGTYTYDAQGKAITYTSPRMSGFGQTLDLTTNEITLDYHAGPLSTTAKTDAQGRGTSFGLKYDLGGGQYHSLDKETDHASGITSTTLTPGGGVDPNKQFSTAGIARAKGVDPAKFAAFQKQNPTAVQENSLSKFLSIVRKNDASILSEGANPHRVALPVQMAMQHYQQPATKPQPRERLIDKYFVEAETAIIQRTEEKRALYNQYAKTIANRVLMKESAQGVSEAPIAMDPTEPNNPTIHNHEKANTMSLKGRIASARAQLQELAELSESNSLLAWEQICKKAKGGMFMGLEQNLEQIRHGIEELAKQRRKGGTASRGIDKHIGEGKTK